MLELKLNHVSKSGTWQKFFFHPSADTQLDDGGYYPATYCEADVEDVTTGDLHSLVDKNIRVCVRDSIV